MPSTISAQAVAQLRARTGVGMLAVKQALDEAGGNEEKAIEILRRRGLAQAVKKADRDQKDGAVFVATEGSGKAAMTTLKCETDFVSRGEAFRLLGQEIASAALQNGLKAGELVAAEKIPAAIQQLGENISIGDIHLFNHPVIGVYVHSNAKIGVVIGLDKGTVEQARDVAMHAAAMSPLYRTPEEVPAEAIVKEKEIWTEQLAKEGKPAAIMEKIMMGKEKKFREENALIKQAFVKDPSKTIEQYLGGAKVVAYVRVSVA